MALPSVNDKPSEMMELKSGDTPTDLVTKRTGLLESNHQQNGVKETRHFRPAEELPHIGKYKFIRTIGKGNFAKVKLARHVITGKEVAIKIIDKTQLSEASRQKLYREVRIMKMMDHPNIVKLYEIISNEKVLYLVMEYASEGELFDYLISNGKLKEKEARIKFRQIVSAVQYCHQKRVVHRDLKAENLLLDASMNIKIADFGFSNEFSAGRKLDTFCGSPPYAAPELFEGRKYDGPEVDVWSLGVILYTLVSGSLPFDGHNLRELRERVLAGKYRVPFYMTTECEALLRRMLHLKPEKRYTLEAVMKDKWINNGFEENPLIPYVEPESDLNDPVRIEIMVNMGFPRQEIVNSLQSASFDTVAATYFLLGRSSSTTDQPSIPLDLSLRQKSSPRTSIIRSSTTSSSSRQPIQSRAAMQQFKSNLPDSTDIKSTNVATSQNSGDILSADRNGVPYDSRNRKEYSAGTAVPAAVLLNAASSSFSASSFSTAANSASNSRILPNSSRKQSNSNRTTDVTPSSELTRTHPVASPVTANNFSAANGTTITDTVSVSLTVPVHKTSVDVNSTSAAVRTTALLRPPLTTHANSVPPRQGAVDSVTVPYLSIASGAPGNRRPFITATQAASTSNSNIIRLSSALTTTSPLGAPAGQSYGRFGTGFSDKGGSATQFGNRFPNQEIRSHVTPAPVPITSRSKAHHQTLFSTSTMSAGFGPHGAFAVASATGQENAKVTRDLPTLNEVQTMHSSGVSYRSGLKDVSLPPFPRGKFDYISLRVNRTSNDDTRPLYNAPPVNSSARTNLTDVGLSHGDALQTSPPNANAFSRLNPERRTVHTTNSPLTKFNANDSDGGGAVSAHGSKNGSANFFKNITQKIGINKPLTNPIVTTSTVVTLTPSILPASDGNHSASPAPVDSRISPLLQTDTIPPSSDSPTVANSDLIICEETDSSSSVLMASGKQVKPRSIRFTWTMKITSVKEPNTLLDEIKRVLTENNCVYEQPVPYLLVCRFCDPSTDCVVEWEMEICKLSRLSMNGVRFKRISGSSVGYQNIVTKLTSTLKS